MAAVALGASGIVGILILEVGLRHLAGGDRFFPYYPESVRLLYPSEAITPGVTGVSRFTTNSYGLRGREPDDRASLRLLTIGGSTTADTVLDDAETWAAVLEAELGRAVGAPETVWVGNSGIDGLNTHHHLMHAKYLLPRLPPIDFVVVHAGINDLGLWLHHEAFDPDYLEDPDHWNGRIGEAFRWSRFTPPDWPVYKRTEIWKTLSRLKNRYLSVQAKGKGGRVIVQDAKLEWLETERARRNERGRRHLAKATLDTLPVALDAYRDMLVRIVEEIRAAGSEPVLVGQLVQATFANDEERGRLWMGELAEGGYIDEEQYPLLLAEFNAVMAEVAAREGVLYVDLASRIEATADLFYDGMHFNEQGARVVGRTIAESLLEAGHVKPRSPDRSRVER